jgi:hypothetical protein
VVGGARGGTSSGCAGLAQITVSGLKLLCPRLGALPGTTRCQSAIVTRNGTPACRELSIGEQSCRCTLQNEKLGRVEREQPTHGRLLPVCGHPDLQRFERELTFRVARFVEPAVYLATGPVK